MRPEVVIHSNSIEAVQASLIYKTAYNDVLYFQIPEKEFSNVDNSDVYFMKNIDIEMLSGKSVVILDCLLSKEFITVLSKIVLDLTILSHLKSTEPELLCISLENVYVVYDSVRNCADIAWNHVARNCGKSTIEASFSKLKIEN